MDKLTVVYKNGEIELDISVEDETVWLTQKQIAEIFQKDQSVISRHINNIFKDGEVDEKSNMQKMHIANSDKPVSFYSLDIVFDISSKYHDRFLILDDDIYHIGASLKDLGKKIFAFSKMQDSVLKGYL